MKVAFLIPYRPDGGRRTEIFQWVHQRICRQFEGLDVHVVSGSNPGEFSRSRSKNELAGMAPNADILVFQDADTIAPVEFYLQSFRTLEANPRQWVLPYTHYYNLSEVATDDLLSRDPLYELPERDVRDRQLYEHDLLDAISGAVVVTREAFEAVNGFDERFIGWGYEDRAFETALTTLWGQLTRLDSHVYHLWHPCPPETTWEQPQLQANRRHNDKYNAARGRDVAMRALVEGNR